MYFSLLSIENEVKILPTSSSTSTLVAEIYDTSNSSEVIRKQKKITTLKVNTSVSKIPNKDSESKKREDLTSLGSDDSGKRFILITFVLE